MRCNGSLSVIIELWISIDRQLNYRFIRVQIHSQLIQNTSNLAFNISFCEYISNTTKQSLPKSLSDIVARRIFASRRESIDQVQTQALKSGNARKRRHTDEPILNHNTPRMEGILEERNEYKQHQNRKSEQHREKDV